MAGVVQRDFLTEAMAAHHVLRPARRAHVAAQESVLNPGAQQLKQRSRLQITQSGGCAMADEGVAHHRTRARTEYVAVFHGM